LKAMWNKPKQCAWMWERRQGMCC